MINGITLLRSIPVNVFVNERAIVTAGFANEVEEVNQYAPVIYKATIIAGSFLDLIHSTIEINSPIEAITSETRISVSYTHLTLPTTPYV